MKVVGLVGIVFGRLFGYVACRRWSDVVRG